MLAAMKLTKERGETQLDTLRTLIDGARRLVGELESDPLVGRILRVMEELPAADRETVVRILEREATWCRIAVETAAGTGVSVRPNPHASLYMHVFDQVEPPSEPLRRDVDVIRFGIDRFVSLVPLLFQQGVHELWRASAYELAQGMEGEQRQQVARLAREVLAIIAEVDAKPTPASSDEEAAGVVVNGKAGPR
jgi:hypothetical protein